MGTVLVVGDALLDVTVRVDEPFRIATEAPIAIYGNANPWFRPGGAGNVAANIKTMGGDPHLIHVRPCVDSDGAYGSFANALECLGVGHTSVLGEHRGLTVKRRTYCGSRMVYREDADRVNHPISTTAVLEKIETLYASGVQIPVAVLSDYGRGIFANDAAFNSVVALCTKHGSRVIVDPKPRRPGPTYSVEPNVLVMVPESGVFAVTPNEGELRTMSIEAGGPSESFAAASFVQARFGFKHVVATLGSRGVVHAWAGGRQHHPTRARSVFDTCGAGDSFIAALAIELSSHEDVPLAILRAQLAASVAISFPGTHTVKAEEWLIARCHGEHQKCKIVDWKTAKDVIDYWRSRGEKIAFTNGCFDMAHPGHLHLIEQARRAGTRLVAGLNSDRSVRINKGEGRPKQPQDWRAELLASNGMVDLVVVFDEDSPYKLIEFLRPEVLVKGEDAKEHNAGRGADGSDLVQETVYVPRIGGHSTTAFLGTLNEQAAAGDVHDREG